jgi:aminoglycoside adenylyltransferase-like protein/nucleotidyltransferase-like protein
VYLQRVGAAEDYLAELRRRVTEIVDVVGIYVGGSVALDAYQPGHSDLDVAVVTPGRLPWPVKDAFVTRLRHESLHCPARGLELVVYSAEDAASTGVAPAFQVNLNTGAGMRFRVDFEPDPAEANWFAVDRAILREHAVVLEGAPAGEVFGEVPRGLLLSVLADIVRWHTENGATTTDTVLNACRALRFATTGEWSSKTSAGWWALDHVGDREVVRAALAARTDGRPPGEAETRRLVAAVLDALDGTQRSGRLTLVPN